MNKLEYGIIKEFDDGTILWYEPITDKIDGFVLRREYGAIIKTWLEEKSK